MTKNPLSLLGTAACFVLSVAGSAAVADPVPPPPPPPAGDYVRVFAKVFLSKDDTVALDEPASRVLETVVFHDADGITETGKCVLEYAWSPLPGRFSSQALDRLEAHTSMAIKEARGEWTMRPEEIQWNLYFCKAGDQEIVGAAKSGTWEELSPYRLLGMKVMGFIPDQSPRIEELVSNRNQSAWLPFERTWKGQSLSLKPGEYPLAILIVKLKGLGVDGYACGIYEYDPQGNRPIQP